MPTKSILNFNRTLSSAVSIIVLSGCFFIFSACDSKAPENVRLYGPDIALPAGKKSSADCRFLYLNPQRRPNSHRRKTNRRGDSSQIVDCERVEPSGGLHLTNHNLFQKYVNVPNDSQIDAKLKPNVVDAFVEIVIMGSGDVSVDGRAIRKEELKDRVPIVSGDTIAIRVVNKVDGSEDEIRVAVPSGQTRRVTLIPRKKAPIFRPPVTSGDRSNFGAEIAPREGEAVLNIRLLGEGDVTVDGRPIRRDELSQPIRTAAGESVTIRAVNRDNANEDEVRIKLLPGDIRTVNLMPKARVRTAPPISK